MNDRNRKHRACQRRSAVASRPCDRFESIAGRGLRKQDKGAP